MEKLAFIGGLGRAGGKALSGLGNFVGNNPVGVGLLDYLTGMHDDLFKTFKPKLMGKAYNPGIKTPESLKLSSFEPGSSKMKKNLKDVLVEKIAKAKCKRMKQGEDGIKMSKTGSLGASVTDKDVNFVSDISQEFKGAAKTAGFVDMLKTKPMETALAAAAAVGLLNVGKNVATGVYGTVRDAVKRNEAYHQMFEEFPNLNELPREQVDKYWGVLNEFAPKLTTNPLVAGQFIDNMATYGMKGIDHNVVGQLAQISHSINQANNGGEMLKGFNALGTSAFSTGAGILEKADDAVIPGV